MAEIEPVEEPTRKLRVFLSYSRKDGPYTARLADALTAQGFLADFDRSTHDKDNVETGISAEDDWWQRLQEMILAADAIVFIVSPDSAASRVCDEEIAYARATGKRVIAILRRSIDFSSAPPRLAALNVKIDATLDDADGFGETVDGLAAALNRDVAWLREHTRLLQAATDWSRSGARDEELLRGAEIAEAESWLARRPFNVTELPDELTAFLNASRLGQAERDERERQTLARQRRMQTWVGGLIALAMVITVAGAAYVVDRQRNVARAQSLTLARTVELYLQRNDFAGALRLAVLASRDTFLSPASDEAGVALASAAAASPLLASFIGHNGAVTGAVLSTDEHRILSWSRDGTTRLWDVETGALLHTHQNSGEVNGARFFANDTRVVSWDSAGDVHIFNVDSDASPDPAPMHFDAAVYNVALTPDEQLLFIGVGSAAPDNRGRRQLVVRRVVDGAAHGQPISLRDMAGNVLFTPDGARALIWTQEFAQMYDVAQLSPVGSQMRHAGAIGGVRLSPDGSRVLTMGRTPLGGSGDNAARLWDASSGQAIGSPMQHSGSILDAEFVSNGSRIVTMSRDAFARVWDGRTAMPLTPPLSHAGPISAETPDDGWTIFNRGVHDADVSPYGALLATTGSDQRLRVWRLDQGGGPLVTMRMPQWAHRVRFSADGSRIFTLDQAGEIRAWDLSTGQTQDSPIPTTALYANIAFTSDRQRALVWSDDGTLALWNLQANRAQLPAMSHGAIVSSAVWIGDNEVLAYSTNGQARVWNTERGAQVGPIILHDYILGAGQSPSGERIITWGAEGTARQWVRETHTQAAPPINAASPIVAASYSSDGARIATIDASRALRLWDANTGAAIGAGAPLPATIAQLDAANQNRGLGYNLQSMYGLQFSPDGSRVTGWANADGAVQIDAQTGAPIGGVMAHRQTVTGATYASDGARIATWSGQTAIINEPEYSVRLWDADGAPLGEPLMHESAVRGALFSPDGAQLLSWTEAGQVVLWDVASRQSVLTLQHVATRPNGNTGFVVGAQFSPDGAQIISWGEDGVKFWDRVSGAPVGRTLAAQSTIGTAVLSTDHRFLVTTEHTNNASPKLRIWDVASHLQITAQGEGAALIYGAQWSADERSILTWGEGGAPQIWRQPWISHGADLNVWAQDICTAQLRGEAMQRETPDGDAWVGVRRISAADTQLAPILRGREGEDVCAWRPKWYDRVFDFLFGWMHKAP